jgi:hypothetical protein
MRDLDLQSASRSTLSSSRWWFRALPVAATVLALASAVFGQPRAVVATTTTLISEAIPASSGGPDKLTLTVHVSPAPQSAEDRGNVAFLDTDSSGQVHSLGSAFVAADGTATLTVSSSMTSGAHSVRAVFNGTESSAASTSAPADVTAQVAAPDFALTATPATLNLDAGAEGTVAVTLAPLNRFSNYVSLSCAGLPLFATCTFLPSNVPVTGQIGLSTMTLNTLAPSGKTSSLRSDSGLVYAFLLPGALGLIGLAFGRSRGLRMVALVCVVGSLIGGTSSCAQRYRYLNHGPTPNPGTPAGKSIIRIYGTSVSGALSNVKCFQLTLNVTSTNTSGTAGNILTPCS